MGRHNFAANNCSTEVRPGNEDNENTVVRISALLISYTTDPTIQIRKCNYISRVKL
jgi:hypothetical protein